jgi:hypothetical protein
MKPLLIALTAAVVLATGSTLAVMNNACKSAQHGWCASHRTQQRTVHRLAPCAGQAALPPVRPVEPLAPARRMSWSRFPFTLFGVRIDGTTWTLNWLFSAVRYPT